MTSLSALKPTAVLLLDVPSSAAKAPVPIPMVAPDEFVSASDKPLMSVAPPPAAASQPASPLASTVST